MTTNLYLSPTTRAAYSHLISRIKALRNENLLSPITILLPSSDVINYLRNQMGDAIGLHIYQFYNLSNAILDKAALPIREINDTAIRRLIRSILQDMDAEGQLTTFAPVAEKPGFVEVILDWLREMKSQGIFPEDYYEYAIVGTTQRDLQLAALYQRYQTFMQDHNYSDTDGLLWLAAEALEENPELFRQDSQLFVLGFDQFTPVQIRILSQLAIRQRTLHIYLLWDKNRPVSSPALSRLHRTRNQLLKNISLEEIPLEEAYYPKLDLAQTHRNIFESAKPIPVSNHALRLIEAPSREREVRFALREVKHLLLNGVSPSQIALLAPNKNAYLPIIRAVSTEYGLPIEAEQPLLDNPAVLALSNLMQIPFDYPWQPTFQALRSPYIRQSWLSSEKISLLDQLTRQRPVLSGRDQWSFALQPLHTHLQNSEDEDRGSPPLVATLDIQTLTDIEAGLQAFFDHLTPPAAATHRDYIWWLQTAIIGFFPDPENDQDEHVEMLPTLDLLACCRENPFAQRDLEALTTLMQTLRRLLFASESVAVQQEISWETFRDEFLRLLSQTNIPSDTLQVKVRCDRLEAARAQVLDYLFVLGLSEGEFPTPPPADALYTNNERLNHPLPLIHVSPSDEASLWWQVIGNVNQQLFLLRPYIDENGAPWQASPYWQAVRACFTDLEMKRLPIADHPHLQNAASLSELLVALTLAGARNIPHDLIDQYNYAKHAESILHQRISYNPPGKFEGILQADDIRSEIYQHFNEQHIWSASRLNRYANCPYGFFAQYVLKLEALRDPEEGLDSLQRGSLLHYLLEQLYQRLSQNGISPIDDNKDEIRVILEETCKSVFPSAPQRYGFRPGALWRYEQKELKRLLNALVIWDCEKNTSARFSPFLQEAGFGLSRTDPPPLEVEGELIHFSLHGLIDRIDSDTNGNLRIIDYKSGSATFSKLDIEKGLALQTVLYALAVEKYWLGEGSRIIESSFWHIPTRKTSGDLKFSGFVLQNETVEKSIQQAALHVTHIRESIFPSAPAKPGQGSNHCSTRCDYAALCRVTRQSLTKARQGGFA